MHSHQNINQNDAIDNKEKHVAEKPPDVSQSLLCQFKIAEYDELCEDYSKISEIFSLAYSPGKIGALVLLNIFTCFTINLFIVWFHWLKLKLIYSQVPLDQGRFLGILGKDGKFYVVPLERIGLPNVTGSFIKTHFNSSVTSSKVLCFSYKFYKYIYDDQSHQFTAFKYDLKSTNDLIHSEGTKGLNGDEIKHQKNLFGECDLNVHINSFFTYLIIELTDPFYIFLFLSIVLWATIDYYAYAAVIVIATVVSVIISSQETRENIRNLQQMVKSSCDIFVYRIDENGNRKRENISSTRLVPGDLIEIPDEASLIPCDCLLISGTAIVNETMLTGKSTPVIKSHLPNKINDEFSSKSNQKHLLYAGTKIIQKSSSNGDMKVIAIVLATGFNTSKGNLIRSILFPKQIEFQLRADSVDYIILMSIVYLCGLTVYFLSQSEPSIIDIIRRTLAAVSPALPTCLGLGISFALGRLRNFLMISINRERVKIKGKIDMLNFDKANTLTEKHLSIYGFRPVAHENNTFCFGPFLKEATQYEEETYEYYKTKRKEEGLKDKNKDLKEMFIECLATCHSTTKIKGQLIGDPIDVKMFQCSGWELHELQDNSSPDSLISTYVRPKKELDLNKKLAELTENDDEDMILFQHYELGVIRRLDFSSQLKRMTVIVKDVNDQFSKIFCKGSPEQIKSLCRQDTIPSNFDEQLAEYTLKGLPVLALSAKMMKMTYIQSQQITRQNIETNMIFLGFLIVKNKTKKADSKSIEEEDKSNLRMVMATADNNLTAVAVCKECSLISNDAIIYSCEIVKENKERKIIWNAIENPNENELTEKHISKIQSKTKKDEDKLMTILVKNKNKNLNKDDPSEQLNRQRYLRKVSEELFDDVIQTKKEDNRKFGEEDGSDSDAEIEDIDIRKYFPNESDLNVKYYFSITGPTFELLSRLRDKYKRSKRKKYKIYATIFQIILKNCFIYANMSSLQKNILINALKSEYYTVMLSGDDANDYGGLRPADVGVTLSPEETSISSNFKSKIPDMSCLFKLLHEGKISLATSIQTIKYMMIYLIIQFISVTSLLIVNSYFSDYQFLAANVFIITPLAIFFAQMGTYRKLAHHNPTDYLISRPIISSIILQTLIAFCFQYGSWVLLTRNIPWYENKWYINENLEGLCWDNTVIYLVSNMQYFITAFSFSISNPLKKQLNANTNLTIIMIFTFIYSIVVVLYPNHLSFNFLQIEKYASNEFKIITSSLSIINFICSNITEKTLIPYIANKWKRWKYSKDGNKQPSTGALKGN